MVSDEFLTPQMLGLMGSVLLMTQPSQAGGGCVINSTDTNNPNI